MGYVETTHSSSSSSSSSGSSNLTLPLLLGFDLDLPLGLVWDFAFAFAFAFTAGLVPRWPGGEGRLTLGLAGAFRLLAAGLKKVRVLNCFVNHFPQDQYSIVSLITVPKWYKGIRYHGIHFNKSQWWANSKDAGKKTCQGYLARHTRLFNAISALVTSFILAAIASSFDWDLRLDPTKECYVFLVTCRI